MATALFLFDTIMNTCTIAVALRLDGMRIQPVRLLLGAVFGAGAALCARRTGIRYPAALWLPAAAGMMIIAAGRRACRRPVHHVILLFSAGGLLGGVVLALAGAFGSLPAAYLAACGCALYLAVRLRRVQHGRVQIQCAGVCMAAMVDTGNTLRDYLTGLPVIALPEGCPMAMALGDALPMRPIFADTAGGRQMMSLCVPGQIRLERDGRKQTVRAAVALSAGLRADSPALVPETLADRGTE